MARARCRHAESEDAALPHTVARAMEALGPSIPLQWPAEHVVPTQQANTMLPAQSACIRARPERAGSKHCAMTHYCSSFRGRLASTESSSSSASASPPAADALEGAVRLLPTVTPLANTATSGLALAAQASAAAIAAGPPALPAAPAARFDAAPTCPCARPDPPAAPDPSSASTASSSPSSSSSSSSTRCSYSPTSEGGPRLCGSSSRRRHGPSTAAPAASTSGAAKRRPRTMAASWQRCSCVSR